MEIKNNGDDTFTIVLSRKQLERLVHLLRGLAELDRKLVAAVLASKKDDKHV